MERSSSEVEGNVDDGAVLARFSLDVSAGCGGRHSTLLDEYERLAFEAQLNRAILRRCYSEPSPARFVVQPSPSSGDALRPAPREAEGEVLRHEPAPGSSWRLHEVVSRWLEMLKPVFCWLRSAREYWRNEQATPRGPPMPPRVQLLDYLC